MKALEETLIELVVEAIGWLSCTLVLAGMFGAGFFVAHWWGKFDPTVAGSISAASFIWMYEHRLAHSRWERLSDQLDRLWQNTTRSH